MSDKICTSCQHKNPASESFCVECGMPLEDEQSAPDTSSAADTGLTCPGCGKEVPDNIKFCDGCGMQLQGVSEPEQEPESEPEFESNTQEASSIDSSFSMNTDTDTEISSSASVDSSDDNDTDYIDVTPVPVEPDTPPDTPDINDLSKIVPDISGVPDTLDTQDGPAQAEADTKRNYQLRVVEGMHTGKTFVLYKSIMMIGREDDESGIFPEIDLEGQDEGYVSREHAIIRTEAEGITLEDLGKGNRTLLDRKPTTPGVETPVKEGQVIRVGKVSLILEGL